MEEQKRLFIGGLFDNVTECELKERFKHFGKVSEIEIRKKKDEAGKPIKTFAYLNINTTGEKIKSCMRALNCTRWRSHELKIEIAKPSFYYNLLKDIAEQKKQLSIEKAGEKGLSINTGSDARCFNKVFHNARLGSEVPDKKDWVIVKYGRALPIMRIRQQDRRKKFKWHDSYFHQTRPTFSNSKQRAENKTKKTKIFKQLKDNSSAKDYHNRRSSTVSKELAVSGSMSKNCGKSVSSAVSKKLVGPTSIHKDANCTELNIISKKLKCNNSMSKDNSVSNSVSKGKRIIDSMTKDSGYTKSNAISKKTKTTNAHKSQHSDPKKVNSLQKSQDISTKPVETTTTITKTVENNALKKTYVNSKVLQKFISTKGSRGLVLRAKPSLLLKYKVISKVKLNSQS